MYIINSEFRSASLLPRVWKSTLRTAAYLSFLTFIGCGKSNETSPPSAGLGGKIGTTDFLIPSNNSGIGFVNSAAQGSGLLLAKSPLGEPKEKKNLSLQFSLKENGSVTLQSFSRKELDNGVSVTFFRTKNSLKVTLEAEKKSVDISKNFIAFDGFSEQSFLIDIHNGETPAHVLIWKGDLADPSEANALFNSEKAGDGESAGNGKGTFWGLVLSQASVKKASVSKAKFEHD
jgi:hypothetical protein